MILELGEKYWLRDGSVAKITSMDESTGGTYLGFDQFNCPLSWDSRGRGDCAANDIMGPAPEPTGALGLSVGTRCRMADGFQATIHRRLPEGEFPFEGYDSDGVAFRWSLDGTEMSDHMSSIIQVECESPDPNKELQDKIDLVLAGVARVDECRTPEALQTATIRFRGAVREIALELRARL